MTWATLAAALAQPTASSSASPPPSVSEVDGVRFTLVSEHTCEANKVRWWRYEPEARSMAACARAAAAHAGCGTSIMWSNDYSYDWGCMCCAPTPSTHAHAHWRIYAFEILGGYDFPPPPSPSPAASFSPPQSWERGGFRAAGFVAIVAIFVAIFAICTQAQAAPTVIVGLKVSGRLEARTAGKLRGSKGKPPSKGDKGLAASKGEEGPAASSLPSKDGEVAVVVQAEPPSYQASVARAHAQPV